jgi:nitrite reductase/ring-hydroxylating ferredoxin subunit
MAPEYHAAAMNRSSPDPQSIPQPDPHPMSPSAGSAPITRKGFLHLLWSVFAAAGLSALPGRRSAAQEPVRMPAPKRAWDKVEFTFPGAGKEFPGFAVRLPQTAGGGLSAVCRICPHQGCLFGYETDYEAVSGIIGKELANPVFFCRCHFGTYDPTRDGTVLYGPSSRPPWRFTVREEGDDMIVTGIETGAGNIG